MRAERKDVTDGRIRLPDPLDPGRQRLAEPAAGSRVWKSRSGSRRRGRRTCGAGSRSSSGCARCRARRRPSTHGSARRPRRRAVRRRPLPPRRALRLPQRRLLSSPPWRLPPLRPRRVSGRRRRRFLPRRRLPAPAAAAAPAAPATPRPPAAPPPAPPRSHRPAASAPSASAAAAAVRLGEPGGGQAVLVDRRHPVRPDGDHVPALFGRARLAAAADPAGDRLRDGGHPPRLLRAAAGAPLCDHRQRARRGGDRRPVLDLLRGAHPLAPPRRGAHLRAPGDGHRRGGGALDPPRLAVHRPAGAARRLRHAGAAVERAGPSGRPLRLPAAAQRRPRLGGAAQGVAGALGPLARLHHPLPVGMGVQVPRRREAAAGARHLPRLPPPRLRRLHPRPGRGQGEGGRGGRPQPLRLGGGGGSGAPARLRGLPRRRAGLRGALRAPLRLPLRAAPRARRGRGVPRPARAPPLRGRRPPSSSSPSGSGPPTRSRGRGRRSSASWPSSCSSTSRPPGSPPVGRPLGKEGRLASLAGPLLLFSFPVLFVLEPAAASPGCRSRSSSSSWRRRPASR